MRDDRHDPFYGTPADPSGFPPRTGPHRRGHRPPRSGTEPVTARSPLGLRLLLSVIYAPLFLAGAALFALWASHSSAHSSPKSGTLNALAITCGVLALLALVDLVVVVRRRRREQGGNR
jgi:hypothetical protein